MLVCPLSGHVGAPEQEYRPQLDGSNEAATDAAQSKAPPDESLAENYKFICLVEEQQWADRWGLIAIRLNSKPTPGLRATYHPHEYRFAIFFSYGQQNKYLDEVSSNYTHTS